MAIIDSQFFRTQVRLEANLAQVSDTAADAVAKIFVDRQQMRSELVGTVIDLTRYLTTEKEAAHKKVKRLALAQLAVGLTTPDALLSLRQREEAVRPHVEQLRRDYFGSAKVPFPSYEKAVRWLRQQAVVGQQKPASQQLLRLVNAVTEVMQRFPKTFDLEFSIGSHAIPLLAPKPGALKGSVGFDKGSALENLKKVTESIANGTGCDVAVCVAHVLAGTPLFLKPLTWEIEFSYGCGLHRWSARIDILQPHAITLPVLAQGYRLIREKLGLSKKKTLAGWHERLIRLVEKRGGVPKRGKTDFWIAIQREWNKAVPRGGNSYDTWMGPKMAYDRLQAALKNRS